MVNIIDSISTITDVDPKTGEKELLVYKDDVTNLLSSDEIRDLAIAALPHADWCCIKGCTQPNKKHYAGDWNKVPLEGDITGLSKFMPCTGSCNCEVGLIVPQVFDFITGGK